jgi:hypothetical protein
MMSESGSRKGSQRPYKFSKKLVGPLRRRNVNLLHALTATVGMMLGVSFSAFRSTTHFVVLQDSAEQRTWPQLQAQKRSIA